MVTVRTLDSQDIVNTAGPLFSALTFKSIWLTYYKNRIDKERDMEAVTISPKFQVVIPKKVRESMQLKPGQQMQVIEYGNRVELIPARNVESMRGFLKGIDTTFIREGDRV